jgi:propanol-preferring alcohol dehydrogenase
MPTTVVSETDRRQTGYRLHAWGADPVWEEFGYNAPGPGEVLVSVEACGVGLTVLNWAAGDLTKEPGLLPRVPGHEVIGRVTQAGDETYAHLLGQRVTAFSYLFCGVCDPCLAGQENRCENLAGWVGLHRDGGYAPYTVLPGRNAVPVGDTVDPVTATVIPDAVSTAVHVCLTRAVLSLDDRVVVIGAAGGIGIHLVQVARLTGASVVGVDIGEPKLAALESIGCRAVDGSDLGSMSGASLWRRGGPTAVIDLVGRQETLQWSLDQLAVGGRLVVLTTFRGTSFDVDPRQMVSREAAIIASRAATRAQYRQAAELVSSGAVRAMIGAVRGPDRVLELHDLLRAGTLIGRSALTWVRDGQAGMDEGEP